MNDVWVPSAHSSSTNCDSTLFHITSTDFLSVMSTTLAIILITIKFLYVFFTVVELKLNPNLNKQYLKLRPYCLKI